MLALAFWCHHLLRGRNTEETVSASGCLQEVITGFIEKDIHRRGIRGRGLHFSIVMEGLANFKLKSHGALGLC